MLQPGQPFPLVPPERIKLHVLSFDGGRTFSAAHSVTDLRGISRVVDKRQGLTIAQVEALRVGRRA